jgi:hypothetical protein
LLAAILIARVDAMQANIVFNGGDARRAADR